MIVMPYSSWETTPLTGWCLTKPVDLWSDIIAMEYPFPHIGRLLLALSIILIICNIALISHHAFSLKELVTSDGCVEMDIPWQ